MNNFIIWPTILLSGIAFVILPLLSVLGVISAHELFLVAHQNGSTILAFAQQHPFIMAALYLFVFIGALALVLPVMTLATIFSGFLFGPVWGTILAMLAIMVGSSLVFFMVQAGLEKKLQQKHFPLYEKLEKFLDNHMWGTMFFLRVIPAFPFSIINLALSLFSIPYKAYALTLFFGTLPAAIIFCLIGKQFQSLTSLDNLFSPQIMGAFIILGVVSLVGDFVKDHFLMKR